MTDTLTQTFNTPADATNYMSVFSDPAGSVTSTVVAVEVVFGPTNKTYVSGVTSNLSVSAVGPAAPTAFQWYFNTSSNFSGATKLANNTHRAGVTTATLTLTNILGSDAGYYWAAVTNAGGFVIPQAATLSVTVTPPSFSSISVSGTNMVMNFTTTNPNDRSSAFTLQSSPVVTGPYTNTTATFTGSAGGPFQVTVPRSASDTMFYRLLHN
jgi:hypothetical protein